MVDTKEIEKILNNIKDFQEKRGESEFFAGWDACLTTVKLDFKQYLLKGKGK